MGPCNSSKKKKYNFLTLAKDLKRYKLIRESLLLSALLKKHNSELTKKKKGGVELIYLGKKKLKYSIELSSQKTEN